MNALPKSSDVIRIIRKSLCELDPIKYHGNNHQLPFYLLTNRGSVTEKEHALIVNKAMGFDEEIDKFIKFTEKD